MAINFAHTCDGSKDSTRFEPMERLKVYSFGATVLFASFGMGEAVYRILFSEFDGTTDRIRWSCCLVWYLPVTPLGQRRNL
jgi:hypothetical protein